MAHLNAIQLTFNSSLSVGELKCQLMQLNQLAFEISGFTFNARALSNTNYETLIHLYKPTENAIIEREYICSIMARLSSIGNIECPERAKQHKDASKPPTRLIMWVPKEKLRDLVDYLNHIAEHMEEKKFTVSKILPSEQTRIRLVGPDAWTQAVKVSSETAPLAGQPTAIETKLSTTKLDAKPECQVDVPNESIETTSAHYLAQGDASQRLGSANDYRGSSFGLTIGRYVEEESVDFIYYNTEPKVVDLIFKGKRGRLLWHILVKNKAHLVGGYRDLDRLLSIEKYKLVPDHIAARAEENAMQD